jgi:hypothetical protein
VLGSLDVPELGEVVDGEGLVVCGDVVSGTDPG